MKAMFEFEVSPDGAEPFALKARWRDVVVWEKSGRDRSMGTLMTDMRAAWLDELAHLAATRQGLYSGTYAEWAANVDLDLVASGEQPDPTPQDPSTEP